MFMAHKNSLGAGDDDYKMHVNFRGRHRKRNDGRMICH